MCASIALEEREVFFGVPGHLGEKDSLATPLAVAGIPVTYSDYLCSACIARCCCCGVLIVRAVHCCTRLLPFPTSSCSLLAIGMVGLRVVLRCTGPCWRHRESRRCCSLRLWTSTSSVDCLEWNLEDYMRSSGVRCFENQVVHFTVTRIYGLVSCE